LGVFCLAEEVDHLEGGEVKRTDLFVCRVSAIERQLLTKIAMQLELTASETFRLWIREKAHEFGIRQTLNDRQPRKQRASGPF